MRMSPSRSDHGDDVARSLADGHCVRGCRLRGVHYASCEDFGAADASSSACPGCVPSPAHDESVVCGRCFGRMRAALRDAPDLLARLRQMTDPSRATVIEDVRVTSSRSERHAPTSSDVLDASDEILRNLRTWSLHLDRRSSASGPLAGLPADRAYSVVSRWVGVIQARLTEVTADVDQVFRLAEALIVRHPEIDEHREAWSIADAIDRWGVERRHRFVHPDVDEPVDVEENAVPVREWHDPLLVVVDAAKRHGLTERTVRRWIAQGELEHAAKTRGPRGSVLTWVRASAVDATAKRMADLQNSGGRGRTRRDTPAHETVAK